MQGFAGRFHEKVSKMRDFDWKIITTLYSTLSITKAAKALYVSQPALTKRIQVIENELGITMLIRDRRGVSFTLEGERIAKKAIKIVSEIQDVKEEARAYKSGQRGILRVGFPPSLERNVAPKIIRQYSDNNPNVRIEMTTLPSQELIVAVEKGDVDVCIARDYSKTSPLKKVFFSDDQVYAVYNRPFSIEDLPNLPYIDNLQNPEIAMTLQRWWDERFEENWKTAFKLTSGDASLSLIREGMGFGIFMDIRFVINEKGLYLRPLTYLDGKKVKRKSWIYYRSASANNPIIMGFLETSNSMKEFLSKKINEIIVIEDNGQLILKEQIL